MSEKVKTILRSAVLLLILLFPNIYACFIASDLASPLNTIGYLIAVGVCLFIPMLFLRRRVYFIVAGVMTFLCAPVEIASLYLNHNPATTTFVGLFYATNAQEVAGILGVVWPWAMLVIAVWGLYFLLAFRQPNEWIIPRHIGACVAGIGLPVLFIGAILFFSIYARRIYHLQSPGEIASCAANLTLMKFHKIYPYNIYLNSTQVAVERREIRRTQEALQPFRFGIAAPSDSIQECYILIIGEAARSGHFALNGYERSTTPHLSKRRNVVSFPHMYAQAGTTEQSVPYMLSRIPVTRHDEVWAEKSLPEAFREAGYRTTWLTNQSRILCTERTKEAMDKCYETGKDISVTNNYDALLLAPLQETLTENAKKQFIVLHTMGSHWRYDTRYTPDCEQFTPALGDDFRLSMISPANRDKLVNAYDNTILYTDRFIDSVCTLVEQQHIPALILYMSDHGENLYDDERNLVLHGNYSTSKWLFHVPLIIWYSDEYAALHPDKIAQLKAHAEHYDNSSMLFASMIDAAGLYYRNDTASDAAMRTRSIFSPDYCSPDTLFVLTAEGDCIALEER